MTITIIAPFVLAVTIGVNIAGAIEPEPIWSNRYLAIKREMSSFTPPATGSVCGVVRRIGGPYWGRLNVVASNYIVVDGMRYNASQLTDESCETLFLEYYSLRHEGELSQRAKAQVQQERDLYTQALRTEQEARRNIALREQELQRTLFSETPIAAGQGGHNNDQPSQTGSFDPIVAAQEQAKRFLTWYYMKSYDDRTGLGITFLDGDALCARMRSNAAARNKRPMNCGDYLSSLSSTILRFPTGIADSVEVAESSALPFGAGKFQVDITVDINGKAMRPALTEDEKSNIRAALKNPQLTDQLRKQLPQLDAKYFSDPDALFDAIGSVGHFRSRVPHRFTIASVGTKCLITHWMRLAINDQDAFDRYEALGDSM